MIDNKEKYFAEINQQRTSTFIICSDFILIPSHKKILCYFELNR
jgi:hypothetical protein